MVRLRGQRAVQGDDVAALPDLVESDVPDPQIGERLIDDGIVGDHVAAEVPREAGHDGADLAGADDADGLAGEVEADEPVEGEVAVADPVVRLVDAAVERQDQRDRVLGHGVRRVRRYSHDVEAEPAGRREVDVVEAGAAERDVAHACCRECGHRGLVEHVVHEHADGLRPVGERHRRQPQPVLELDDLMAEALVGAPEGRRLVRLGRVHRDSHRPSIPSVRVVALASSSGRMR